MKEEPLDRTLWKRSGGDYGPDVRETGEELDDSRNYYTQSGSPNRSIKCSQGASRAEIVQSVTRLAAGWKVRGSNPSEVGGGRFSAPVQTSRGVSPRLVQNRHRVSFPGVKRPERGVDHSPPHLAPRLKEE